MNVDSEIFRMGRISPEQMTTRLAVFREVLDANPGLCNAELGDLLGVHATTVRAYRKRIGSAPFPRGRPWHKAAQ